jgi:hypothetical protein
MTEYPEILQLRNITMCKLFSGAYGEMIAVYDNESRKYWLEPYMLTEILRNSIQTVRVIKKRTRYYCILP